MLKIIKYKINTKTGYCKLVDNNQPAIHEYENNVTRLVFEFSQVIPEGDRLYIQITNGTFRKPYRLVRVNSHKYCFDLPREALKRGRLVWHIQRYDKDMIDCKKYTPETYLYVTAAGDITNDMLDSRPDLFAELYWRLERLERHLGIDSIDIKKEAQE